MTASVAYPVRVDAALQPRLSRWLWLVKWLLALPHYVVLLFLWAAYVVLSLVALVAIVVTGRYPRTIFDFNVGVLRWTWRVTYYAYGGLGTDRYPPFRLQDDPTYPAHLEVAYPEHLSRGLALVKWWLLAVPHYLVLGFFLGGGWWLGSGGGDDGPGFGGVGLIGLLVLVAAVVLLVTGGYPRSLFDLVLGLNRWVLRVAAYSSLMTDRYPPFRLDMGGADPGTSVVVEPVPDAAVALGEPSVTRADPGTPPPAQVGRSPWTAGRVVGVVLSSALVLTSLGLLAGGAVLRVFDEVGRDADGYVSSHPVDVGSAGFAVRTDDLTIHTDAGVSDLPERLIGTVRIEAVGDDAAIFVGVAPSEDVAAYLQGVSGSTLVDLDDDQDPEYEESAGGAPESPPGAQDFWMASSEGSGRQVVTFEPEEGEWTAVVMNADGSAPVEASVQVGATLPLLDDVAYALLGVGAVLLVLGMGGLWLSLRRRSETP